MPAKIMDWMQMGKFDAEKRDLRRVRNEKRDSEK
jgi:hypothetical protein